MSYPAVVAPPCPNCAEREREIARLTKVLDLARLVPSQSYADPEGGWTEEPIVGHALVHIRRQLVKDIHVAVAEYDAALSPTGASASQGTGETG